VLTPNDIAEELKRLVAEKFPGEDVHMELTPQGFKRPCTLIVQEPWEADPKFSQGIITLYPVFTMTTFVEADEYHHSHLAPMHQRQLILLGLFLPGYIKVGDRAPHVEKLAMGGGYDFDTVTVTFSYTLDRADFETTDTDTKQAPEMQHLHLNEEVRTFG
jgi:hypothetical protein